MDELRLVVLRWWVEGALERLRDIDDADARSITADAIRWLEDGLADRPIGYVRPLDPSDDAPRPLYRKPIPRGSLLP